MVDTSTTVKPRAEASKGRTLYRGSVPRHSGIQGPPRAYVDGEWPGGKNIGPEAVGYAQEIARRLAAAVGDRSYRQVAGEAGVDHTTISGIISGEHWPDVVTLAKLEGALEARLWPE